MSQDKRFEVDGAEAARAFLLREAPSSAEWDRHRIQLVWDAIALHTTGSIVFHKEPEVQACAHGIWADLMGPGRMPAGLLAWAEYDEVVREFPRLGFMKCLQEVLCGLCRTKPQTTFDNFVGEIGDRFVEGFDRSGHTVSELLEGRDLDEREGGLSGQ